MKLWKYIKDIFIAAKSLIDGMEVTIRYMFKKPVTVQYPKEKLTMTKNFRGPIQFVLFEKTGTHNCIGCFLCANICPTDCYTIEASKQEGGQKRPTKFIYNLLQCSLCNLCVQVCPTKTLEHSKEYDTAGYTRDEYHAVNFINQVKERADRAGIKPKAPPAKAPPAETPKPEKNPPEKEPPKND